MRANIGIYILIFLWGGCNNVWYFGGSFVRQVQVCNNNNKVNLFKVLVVKWLYRYKRYYVYNFHLYDKKDDKVVYQKIPGPKPGQD